MIAQAVPPKIDGKLNNRVNSGALLCQRRPQKTTALKAAPEAASEQVQ
ncbi:hypothetical protein F6453_3791 [Marinobacter nauticus]|uniref:Uncharacterized protein n=1 Tax=Marinobacter nauticus TaxID=2743 RepID=A0A833JL73_MARNT|nr:hypothetical protein F6453_3791 [Marinobacter nauticus]